MSGGPVSLGGSTRRGLSAIRSCSYVGFFAITGTVGAVDAGGECGSDGAVRAVGFALGPRPEHQPVGQAQIDGGQRTIQHRVVLLQLGQPIQRGDLMPFGQHHVGAVGHPQVPPAFADADAGATFSAKCRTVAQRVEQFRRGAGCPEADDQRQMRKAGDVLVGNDLSGAIDQDEFSLILPDGERPPLLQIDNQTCPAADAPRSHARPTESFRYCALVCFQ